VFPGSEAVAEVFLIASCCCEGVGVALCVAVLGVDSEVGGDVAEAPGVRKRISLRTLPSSPMTVRVMCTVPDPSLVVKVVVCTPGPSMSSSKRLGPILELWKPAKNGLDMKGLE